FKLELQQHYLYSGPHCRYDAIQIEPDRLDFGGRMQEVGCRWAYLQKLCLQLHFFCIFHLSMPHLLTASLLEVAAGLHPYLASAPSRDEMLVAEHPTQPFSSPFS